MSDDRDVLEKIVNDFSVGAFVGFFRNKSTKFGERKEAFNQYNDENFKKGEKIGEIIFAEAEQLAVFCLSGEPSIIGTKWQEGSIRKRKKDFKRKAI